MTEIDSKIILKEFDKINTDDFCAWFLFEHLQTFERLHKEYLRHSLAPDEIKEFSVDFKSIKNELDKRKLQC